MSQRIRVQVSTERWSGTAARSLRRSVSSILCAVALSASAAPRLRSVGTPPPTIYPVPVTYMWVWSPFDTIHVAAASAAGNPQYQPVMVPTRDGHYLVFYRIPTAYVLEPETYSVGVCPDVQCAASAYGRQTTQNKGIVSTATGEFIVWWAR